MPRCRLPALSPSDVFPRSSVYPSPCYTRVRTRTPKNLGTSVLTTRCGICGCLNLALTAVSTLGPLSQFCARPPEPARCPVLMPSLLAYTLNRQEQLWHSCLSHH